MADSSTAMTKPSVCSAPLDSALMLARFPVPAIILIFGSSVTVIVDGNTSVFVGNIPSVALRQAQLLSPTAYLCLLFFQNRVNGTVALLSNSSRKVLSITSRVRCNASWAPSTSFSIAGFFDYLKFGPLATDMKPATCVYLRGPSASVIGGELCVCFTQFVKNIFEKSRNFFV